MKMISIKLPILTKLTAILLLVCQIISCAPQTVKVATEDKVQLHKTAKSIIAQSIYINTLLDTCAKIGDDAEYQAVNVQQDWLAKNWAATLAADNYYSQQLRSEVMRYNDMDLALDALLLAHNAQNRAIKELNLKQRTSTNQQKTCLRRTQAIAANEMTLSQDPQTMADLQFLQEKYSGGTQKIVSVPTLAGDLPINLEPGRSYFVLLEEFKKECPEARFLMLHNQWPNEAYGTYCGEVPVSFITCEWGKCQRL